jgi:hypothetical protein
MENQNQMRQENGNELLPQDSKVAVSIIGLGSMGTASLSDRIVGLLAPPA